MKSKSKPKKIKLQQSKGKYQKYANEADFVLFQRDEVPHNQTCCTTLIPSADHLPLHKLLLWSIDEQQSLNANFFFFE